MLSFDRLTVKAGEAIQAAAVESRRRGNPEVHGVHLLLALLDQQEGIVVPVLQKLGLPVPLIRQRTDEAIGRMARVEGGAEPRLSRDLNRALDVADQEARRLGDEYVSTEHLLLGLTEEADDAGRIILWNTAGRSPLPAAIEGHQSGVNAMAFAADSSFLVTGSCAPAAPEAACPAGEISVWNLPDGSRRARFEDHAGEVTALALSAGDRYLASSDDETLIVRELPEGQIIREIEAGDAAIASLAFSPTDPGLLAYGSEDGSVRVIDLASGAVAEFVAHSDRVSDVAFSPAGDLLATGSRDGTIALWQAGQEWLPLLTSMSGFGSYCLTEPGAGSDAAAITTSAIRDGDEFVLTGVKQFISGGGEASVYIVMARTGDPVRAGSPRSSCRPTRQACRSASLSTRWGGTRSRRVR